MCQMGPHVLKGVLGVVSMQVKTNPLILNKLINGDLLMRATYVLNIERINTMNTGRGSFHSRHLHVRLSWHPASLRQTNKCSVSLQPSEQRGGTVYLFLPCCLVLPYLLIGLVCCFW